MGRRILGFAMIVCGVSGLLYSIKLLSYEWPIYLHFLFVDYADPKRPGHLKGVITSTPEIAIKTAVAVVLVGSAVWMFLRLRNTDDN